MDIVADSTGSLPSNLLLNDRVLPRKKSVNQRKRTLNHRVRLAAKKFAEQHPNSSPCESHDIACAHNSRGQRTLRDNPTAARQHAEWDIKSHYCQTTLKLQHAPKAHRSGVPWGSREDHVALAHSSITLPSDHQSTLQRHPSLEREDAFCDASTYKRGKVHVARAASSADDAQVAELYRLGLLYDENDRSQGDSIHNLNDIPHDDPVFSIRRARRTKKPRTRTVYDSSLPLQLSFSDLGKDDELAQFFATNSGDGKASPVEHIHLRTESAPLRVIYELATSEPSYDVDTSQPPDLMDDSEYDCFSDSELDDGSPSQREVHSPSASGPWVLLGDDS